MSAPIEEFDQPYSRGTTHGDPFLSSWQTNPTAGTPEDAAAQLDMAGDLDRALKARSVACRSCDHDAHPDKCDAQVYIVGDGVSTCDCEDKA